MKQGSVRRGRYEYDIEAGKQQAGNILAEVYFRGKTAERQSGGTAYCPAALLFGGYALRVRNGSRTEAGLVSVLRHKAGRFFRI